MHKLESLALSCGSKIHKPYVHKSYYPIKFNDFICVSQNSNCKSNFYDYFNDVIFHIKPYLDINGIQVIELGSDESTSLFYTENYKSLNIPQSNYIISKSKLFFGNFSFLCHVSSALNIPTVCPIQNTFVDLERPYWSSNTCHIVNPNSKLKPTFEKNENPKTINTIYPEVLGAKILDSLNIDHNLNQIQTVFVGSEYNQNIIDIVPGNYSPNNLNVGGTLNVRMDKNFNLDFLNSCSKIMSFNLITDKPIPIESMRNISNNISGITYFINLKTELESLISMESLGKPLNLLTKDSKNISKIRLKFIDHQVRRFGSLDKKSLNNGDYKNLKFLSKRNIIFEGKAYNSYSSAYSNSNNQDVKYSKEFLEDLPFCRVYKETA